MRGERRKSFRIEWHAPATVHDESAYPCVVSNFSNGGAKIIGVRTAMLPDEFALQLTPGHRRLRKCRVIWRSGDALGVQFTDRPASAPAPLSAHQEREPTG